MGLAHRACRPGSHVGSLSGEMSAYQFKGQSFLFGEDRKGGGEKEMRKCESVMRCPN